MGFVVGIRANGEHWLVCEQCGIWASRIHEGDTLELLAELLSEHIHAQ